MHKIHLLWPGSGEKKTHLYVVSDQEGHIDLHIFPQFFQHFHIKMNTEQEYFHSKYKKV